MNAAALGGILAAISGLVVALGVTTYLVRGSGWKELSEAYPCRTEFPRERWLGSGVFRGWLGYNNAIYYAADSSGLYMRGLPILLANHEPIFIPTNELELIAIRRWYGGSLKVVTTRASRVDFAIRGRVVERLRSAGLRVRPENS